MLIVMTLLLGWWIALRLRAPLPKVLYQIWFGLVLVAVLATTGILCKIWTLVAHVIGIRRHVREDICVAVGWFCYKFLLILNPQIRIRWDGASFERWSAAPPGAAMCANHTSQIDPFVATAAAPLRIIKSSRSYVKASLTKIPIFKWYFFGAGHFPVHFVSDAAGVFTVDKERQVAVGARVTEHMARGGRLAFFPEGAVNKVPRSPLQPFRIGAFNTIAEFRAPVTLAVFKGCDTAWPPREAIGGFPADITIFFDSFKVDHETESPAEVAERLRRMMQEVYERL